MGDQSKFFFIINGREVFDNGLTKLWRCAECKSWRQWDVTVCPTCKAARDMLFDKPKTQASGGG
jgi:hypothetical protein